MTRSRYFKLVIAPVRTGNFRPCRDTAHVHHGFDYPTCDCLRRELPVEHQAKSSGRLGTPERNHDCPACNGVGALGCGGIGFACCPRCAGAGEVRFDRSPAGVPTDAEMRVRDLTDRYLRTAATTGRNSGRLGRRA